MNNEKFKYRHEFKYVISNAELKLLQNRVSNLLDLDINTTENGIYNIRSLYFDDYYDGCFKENINGTDPREKFRIRIYNHSTEKITLECKRKERGMTHKSSCPLSVEQTKQLMCGIPLKNIAEQPPLLKKFTAKMLLHKLKPVIIVEYDRIPFVYKNGNVRVTFDTNISSSKAIEKFLDNELPKRPVMPMGKQLLEVKYDEFLPDYIYRNLQISNLTQTAFSKYAICRKFTI